MPEYPNEYEYVRALIGESYDIDNILRVDGEGLQIHIGTEIKVALPGKIFRVECEGTVAKAYFTVALTAGEKITLDQVFEDHKANN